MPISETIVRGIIADSEFIIAHHRQEKRKEAQCSSYEDLGLSSESLDLLKSKGINLWSHQYNAIKYAKEGRNVCVTTSTSSGKTEIFQISALELRAKIPNGKILAVYPMKALNRQQVERWQRTGLNVGKIDGDVPSDNRFNLLRYSDIVVMTPDVIHSWLLKSVNDRYHGDIVRDFIKGISLVIIDELHLYKGLFGTNSAYVFRRLNNVRRLLRGDNSFAQYITASATLPNAVKHSFDITGVDNFIEIGAEQDGSPLAEKHFYFVEKSPESDNSSKALVVQMVKSFAKLDNAKSITFVEGRQRAGGLAIDAMIEAINPPETNIYPYRAGYEQGTIDVITEKLHDGNFKGVFSTSALEIGIDIDGLNIAIIADMPYDKNSYQQRIGRVGRYGCDISFVIIVKDENSFASKLLFEEYNYDIDKVLPSYEPSLYLEDKNVQCVHALCHVGDHDFCEYQSWKQYGKQSKPFNGGLCFPDSFTRLCNDVLTNQYPKRYGEVMDKCRDASAPHQIFALRFFGTQFAIKASSAEEYPNLIPQEMISREMISTEGYIGAVRNTMSGNEFLRERIVWIDNVRKEIIVRRENDQEVETVPRKTRYVVPNFKSEFRNSTMCCGKTMLFNLGITECRTIYGYFEQHGRGRIYYYYNGNLRPIRNNSNSVESNGGINEIISRKPYRLPNLMTTGTIIFHPSFDEQGVSVGDIAEILFETFLKRNAFDRNDINYCGGRLFISNDLLEVGRRFVALYDANELNITNRLTDKHLIKGLFCYLKQNVSIIAHTVCPNINDATVAAIESLCDSILSNEFETPTIETGQERTIKHGSKVVYTPIDSEDSTSGIEGIFCGYSGDLTTCAVLVNGQVLFEVSLDNIMATEDTVYQ